MEGRPELPPLDPLRYGHPVPPFHLHAGLLSTSAAAAHAFPYLSSLTGGGGNGLGALGGSPFRTPHSASSAAAMRQFWPPTPPPDSYGRYGAGYYSLFPPVGSLGSSPDAYSSHQALFPRLGHGTSPYSPVLDLHRDPNFLSPGLSLGSPLTPTNLTNHVSPISPLATSSLLSPPTTTTPGGTSTDALGSQGREEKPHREYSDGLLATVHQVAVQRVGPKTSTRDRSAEKTRCKKPSQKTVPKDLTAPRVKESKPEPRCAKCSWNARAEVPPWPVPPTSAATKMASTAAAPVTTTASSRGSASVGGSSGTSLTFSTSSCIPSDQVSSTVPSPSAHQPSLLSPSGLPVVSSSTPDVEPVAPVPGASASPLPDSSKPPTPLAVETTVSDGPKREPVATVVCPAPEKEEKALDLSDPPVAPTDLSLSPCSSTTADDKRTTIVTVSPMPAKPVLPLEESPSEKLLPKEEEDDAGRPNCRYDRAAPTKREPVDFRCEPVASCVVKPRLASAYVPLNKAAVMLSVQQTKVVSATRVRGCKTGGVAVGLTKAAATSRAPMTSPLTQGSPRVQEVAPVNLKVTKPLASETGTPTTMVVQRGEVAPSSSPPTLGVAAPRVAVAPEARKIVVEEKCDTTVSVVPALSVLNAANQHIPVGIAVARQRQDHTITCSKTSLSSSSSEQGQITAVSCSTVILTTGNSDRNSCTSEPKHGQSPHQGIAEATTACLVAAGPSTSHSPWDQHATDALGLRPTTATLRWLAAPPVANTSPSVVAPTLWLGHNAAPLDPSPSSTFPLASGGFQLARDAVTGQLYLVPTASWTLTSPAAPVQQILTQQHTTFQQILPETWSTEVMKPAEVMPKLEATEAKDVTAALTFSTLAAAPQQSVMSYVYDAAPAAPPPATSPAAAVAPIVAPMSKVSQGTSPPTSMTPSPPPQQVVVEQGVQASDTDAAVDESDDDFVRADAVHVTKIVNRVTSVTTAVQVDMDSQTTSDDNETDDGTVCNFVGTSDSANQTDDLPLQKEIPSSCDEATCDEEDGELHQTAPPASSLASISNQSSEIHFGSDSEIDDSIPVLTTHSSGVREFIDHHGLDLLVDSIEEYAAAQEAEMEGMPQLMKSTSPTSSLPASPAGSPRDGGPPDLSADSPSSRPGEYGVRSRTSSPKLVLASPVRTPSDSERSSPQPLVVEQRTDVPELPQKSHRSENIVQDFDPRALHTTAAVTDTRVQEASKFSDVSSETRSELRIAESLRTQHGMRQSLPITFEESVNGAVLQNLQPQSSSSLSSVWTTTGANWQGSVDVQKSTDATNGSLSQTGVDYPLSYHETYDGSCTDGLGLLCALAEQRFLEESRKEQEKPEPAPEPFRPSNEEEESDKEPETMDLMEREVRTQLADLKRKFKEKQQELARLHPRKGLGSDAEETSISKKQAARLKKRRHSVAAVGATSPSGALEEPKLTERVPSLHATDGFFSVVQSTREQGERSDSLGHNTNKTATCESRDIKKEDGHPPCVPVLTIKFSPEQIRDEAPKFEITESESAGDTGPVSKKRKKKSSARQRKSSFEVQSTKYSKEGDGNEKDKISSPDARRPAKKSSRSKEDKRPKSFSEDDFWCVRRSERIFLLDAGVVSSSSLSIPDHPEKPTAQSTTRSRPEKKKTKKRELVSFLKKCQGTDEAEEAGAAPDADTDSDSAENVPLSRLSSRERPPDVQEQQCNLEPGDLHDLTRVVMLEDGLFYAGYINEIQAPDVYGITLDGERGNRPHIFSQEEILKEAVREVKPRHLREVSEGRRVCAYWSQQYRCLYPGVVAKATSPNPASGSTLVYVEFDDGDSGKIPLEDVRLLPQDYPTTGADPHPSLVLNKKRRRLSQDAGGDPKDGTQEGHSKKMKKRKKSKKMKTKETTSSGHDSEDSDVFGSPSAAEEKGSGAAKKRRREHKHRHHHKHHRCHHKRKHRHRHKHQDTQRSHDGDGPKRGSGPVAATLGSSSERSSGCSANCSPSAAAEESRDGKRPELTVRIRTSSTELQQADSDVEDESSADASEDSSGSSSDENEAAEDRAPSASAPPEQTDTKKPAKRKERLPSVEKSKIAAFLPVRQLWRWSGKSFRRFGTKGKAKKEFYKSICRGKETISVGDCAVFLSTGRPNLPYIGRIETMWQSWGGNMIVRVKWFYHPDETKGLAKLIQPKGALFQSPHADENDVQTISHKCEVLSWDDYRAVCRADAADGTSDVYYLAGSYDPYANVISIEPKVKL